MSAQNVLMGGKRPRVLMVNSFRVAALAFGVEPDTVGAYALTVAPSLSAAAELLRQSDFDVLASDVTADGGDGLALASLLLDLRASGELADMPGILWCGHAEDAWLNAHARLARRAGVSVQTVSALQDGAAQDFIRRSVLNSRDDGADRCDQTVDEQDLIQSLLSGGDVRTVIQPRVELATGRVVGGVATACWKHAELGDIPTSRVLALANESGLNVLLFHRISAQVVALLRTLARLDRAVPIAVGVSASTLCTDDLAQRLEQRLTCAGVEDKRLFVLELTANSPVPDILALSTAMGILRLRGFPVSMGAFGGDGTTLDLLAQLPFLGLKIDRLLVREMRLCSAYDAAVKAAIQLGHDLGGRVVAGGVDSQEDVAVLIERRCDIGQGAAFFPPMEPDDFVALLAKSDRPDLPFSPR